MNPPDLIFTTTRYQFKRCGQSVQIYTWFCKSAEKPYNVWKLYKTGQQDDEGGRTCTGQLAPNESREHEMVLTDR